MKLPPGINFDNLVPPDPRPDAKKIFDKPLTTEDDKKRIEAGDDIRDLDPDEDDDDDDDDDDVILETSFCQPDALPHDCPFSFLYLSSENSTRDEALDDLTQLSSLYT